MAERIPVKVRRITVLVAARNSPPAPLGLQKALPRPVRVLLRGPR